MAKSAPQSGCWSSLGICIASAMKADLHVHSTASDGTLTPTELVDLAVARGLDVLAIADHDSVEGLPEALEAAERSGLTLITAVELSAVHNEHDVHVLGYFVRHDDPVLLEHLSDLRSARLRRARSMVAALNEAGFDLTLDDILMLSDGGAVGRSHIARALVAGGHAGDIRDAFERLIGRDKPYYVAKDVRSPAEVIDVIRQTGGVAVIAHPGASGVGDLPRDLVTVGLGGIEAFHADHTPEQRAHYSALANELGLLVTGGSDFHGPAAPNPPLGSIPLPSEAVEALLACGKRLK